MGQVRLHIVAPRTEAERLYRLAEVEFEDDGHPVAINGADEKNTVLEVSVYVDENRQEETARRLSQAAGIDIGLICREVLPDINWVQHSLEGLKPVRAGRFFVHGAHDRARMKANDLGIEIEAGQAFGTGHHGTTAGCLDMLGALMRREHPRNILDLGTGSGVLAIALAKLQPVRVLATDIDPVAVHIARENSRLNSVARSVDVINASGFHHARIAQRAPFDLIVANILARPLMKMAPDMARALSFNGSLVLSGILRSQRAKVLAACRAQGLYHRRTLDRQGWVTLHLKQTGI